MTISAEAIQPSPLRLAAKALREAPKIGASEVNSGTNKWLRAFGLSRGNKGRPAPEDSGQAGALGSQASSPDVLTRSITQAIAHGNSQAGRDASGADARDRAALIINHVDDPTGTNRDAGTRAAADRHDTDTPRLPTAPGDSGDDKDKPPTDPRPPEDAERNESLETRARELARLTREQGAGLLGGRMPPDWFSSSYAGPKLISDQVQNLGIMAVGAFYAGADITPSGADIFNRQIPYLDQPHSILRDVFSLEQMESLGLDLQHIRGKYFLITEPGPKGWQAYHLSIPSNDYDHRPGSDLQLRFMLPPKVAQQFDTACYRDPQILAEYVKALYPGVVEISGAPNQELAQSRLVLPALQELWYLNRRDNPNQTGFWRNVVGEPDGWHAADARRAAGAGGSGGGGNRLEGEGSSDPLVINIPESRANRMDLRESLRPQPGAEQEFESALLQLQPGLRLQRFNFEGCLHLATDTASINDSLQEGALIRLEDTPEMRVGSLLRGINQLITRDGSTNRDNLASVVREQLRSLHYTPRQIGEILDILGVNPDQRFMDPLYLDKRRDLEARSTDPAPAWRMEDDIWTRSPGYQDALKRAGLGDPSGPPEAGQRTGTRERMAAISLETSDSSDRSSVAETLSPEEQIAILERRVAEAESLIQPDITTVTSPEFLAYKQAVLELKAARDRASATSSEGDSGSGGQVPDSASGAEVAYRRALSSIEGAFDGDTLTGDTERLVRFFDGIAQATEVVDQLPESQRTALGDRILDEVYDSLGRNNIPRARYLSGLVFSLGIQNSFDEETREILTDTTSLVVNDSAPGAINRIDVLGQIRGAFNSGGNLDVENPDRVIEFFDGIAQATEVVDQLPESQRTALGDRILDEVGPSLSDNIPRAKRLANIILLLNLENSFDAETQEILQDTASL